MSGLPDETAHRAVALVVRDLDASVAFYERAIGLEVLGASTDGEVDARRRRRAASRAARRARGAASPSAHDGALPLRDPGAVAARARAVAHRLVEAGCRLTGASDHLVSEALYLDDPDGLGIEIYRDRPRAEWPRDGETVRMATLPLDLQGLVADGGQTLAGEGIGWSDPGYKNRPRAPERRRDSSVRAVLVRRDRLRRHRPQLSGRALRLGGRLPPPPRPQHLERARGAPGAGGAVGLWSFEVVTTAAGAAGARERLAAGAWPRGQRRPHPRPRPEPVAVEVVASI